MTFEKSIEIVEAHIEEAKNKLNKIDENYRNRSTNNTVLDGRFSACLPSHVLAFMHEITISFAPQNSFDPWASAFSPSVISKLPNTDIISSHQEEYSLIVSLCKGHKVNTTNGDGIILIEDIDKSYDLVTSVVPFGFRLNPSIKKIKSKEFKNFREVGDFLIAKSCELLSQNGVGVFCVSNQFFMESNPLESWLNDKGFYVDTIFGLPGKTLSYTAMELNIIVIKRGELQPYRYSEICADIGSLKALLNNYIGNDTNKKLKGIEHGKYKGVSRQRAREQIERLETQYKRYKTYTLQDIAEIKVAKSKETFVNLKNTLTISRFGRFSSKGHIKGTKPNNCFYVVLDEDIALSEYLEVFFRSTLGDLILHALKSGSTIESISKQALCYVEVPIPSIQTQQDIILVNEKLKKMQEVLSDFNAQLALNPMASNKMTNQLDEMAKAVGRLSEEDRIRGLIRAGESKILEFKETLSWDVRNKEKNQAMELMCLKTIAAFLNSAGGTLIIGVADDGSIPGISFELEKLHRNNSDKLLTHFKNLLKSRIGEQYYTFFDVRFSMVGEACVVIVECRPSDLPCFLKGPEKTEEFYVRAPAATDKLDTRKAVEYIQSHWK